MPTHHHRRPLALSLFFGGIGFMIFTSILADLMSPKKGPLFNLLVFMGVSKKSWALANHNEFVMRFSLSLLALLILARTGPLRKKVRDMFSFRRNKTMSGEYVDENGYVRVLTPQYKHRIIAEQILHRKLQKNEVVHHIDGIKNNNVPQNLCVMDRTKHEQFHAWMDWKKSKEGKYPGIEILKEELIGPLYQGILLG